MTQFIFVILTVGIAVGVLGAPWWLTPLFMALGYVAGINYHGDLLIRRLVAYLHVRGREITTTPRIINIDAEWQAFAEQSKRTRF